MDARNEPGFFNFDAGALPFDAIRHHLAAIGRPGDLIAPQAFALAIAGMRLDPDIAIDLGTGYGNSSCILSTVCRAVHSFDLADHWTPGHPIPEGVTRHLGDLTQFDFTPLLVPARRVLLFWDAHGFDIAEHVLGHILPLIAGRPHVVLCHDISDNRYLRQDSYGGKRMWRGMSAFYETPDEFANFNLGWLNGNVDQLIPILDFCSRNGIELRSLDHEFSGLPDGRQKELQWMLDREMPDFHMVYFSASGTRHFPRYQMRFNSQIGSP